ncbi:DUF5684 domain-containing protein [Novisyntrophococcus fermenticellae]|uniref:DUF5684 domain-containing protein n=1 Tax=Novisyntrophococcus fermenticellae TaxID=2068655 RepID=UPI001E5F6661|nr:DUF5684 domain-containing protein [Novisyntrophococcus fermenticellae]
MIFNLIVFLLSLGFLAWLAVIAIVVLSVVGMWMIFVKAGESGWKSLIPVYNIYILYKICWNVKAFALMLVLEIIGSFLDGKNRSWFIGLLVFLVGAALLAIQILFCAKLAGSFGRSLIFAAGLFFFNTVFIMILGLGSSRYYGPDRGPAGI